MGCWAKLGVNYGQDQISINSSCRSVVFFVLNNLNTKLQWYILDIVVVYIHD